MALLLGCRQLTKAYGAAPLFADLSFGIDDGDRIGLVGPNGSGKSTLLRVLAGLEPPDDGTIALRRFAKLAYVPQHPAFAPERTVGTLVEDALAGDDLDDVARTTRVRQTLARCGLDDPSAMPAALSGGWQKRLAIALALVRVPDLDPVHADGFFETRGRYSEFLEQKDAALRAQARWQETLANRVRREIDWLRHGPKARTTKAQARVREAGRLIDTLASVQERQDRRTAGIDFGVTDRRTRRLVVAEHVAKRFGDPRILDDVNVVLGPGTRLGLLGPNGSGKSTLIR